MTSQSGAEQKVKAPGRTDATPTSYPIPSIPAGHCRCSCMQSFSSGSSLAHPTRWMAGQCKRRGHFAPSPNLDQAIGRSVSWIRQKDTHLIGARPRREPRHCAGCCSLLVLLLDIIRPTGIGLFRRAAGFSALAALSPGIAEMFVLVFLPIADSFGCWVTSAGWLLAGQEQHRETEVS